jgi:hypothetical protein
MHLLFVQVKPLGLNNTSLDKMSQASPSLSAQVIQRVLPLIKRGVIFLFSFCPLCDMCYLVWGSAEMVRPSLSFSRHLWILLGQLFDIGLIPEPFPLVYEF